MSFKPDKSKLTCDQGRPLTQGLFLEIGYTDYAYYTLKDYDHELNGKKYVSLKRLYLEMCDPIEYEFANTYLLGWSHWQRLQGNKIIKKHIDEWRTELELKIRSEAIGDIISSAQNDGNFQAAKWLADRGWDKRGAGRPSKDELKKEQKIQERLANEYGADIKRLQDYK